jgi:uncharacterized alpha/beta hydrolase family protein
MEALALSIITIVIAVIITSAIIGIIIIIISMRGRWAPPTSGKQEPAPTIYVSAAAGENTTKKKLPSPSNQ